MSEKEEKKREDGGPEFDFNKATWPKFVREAKSYLFEGKLNASWTIEKNQTKRSLLKDQSAPLILTGNAPADAIATQKQQRIVRTQQLTVYHFLEKRFYATNPALLKDVDYCSNNFATVIFTDLDEEYKPEGMNYIDYKLNEKDTAFDKFNGDPHTYFEKLFVVTSELTDLGIAKEVTLDLKRAGCAIFRFAIREGAT
eukprot:2276998-Rhodomonas_salina.3